MKITSISYGRTIIHDDGRRFGQEKSWFGWEAAIEEGDNVESGLNFLREKADKFEKEDREMHASRDRKRRNDDR